MVGVFVAKPRKRRQQPQLAVGRLLRLGQRIDGEIVRGRVEIEHMHEHGVARDSTFIAPADGTPPTGLIGVRRHLMRG